MPIAGVVAAAASVGLRAATAAGAFDRDRTPEPSYMRTGKEAMDVEEALAGRRLALAQEYSPQYQGIQQRLAQQVLFGSARAPGLLTLAEEAEPRMSALTAAAQRSARETAIRDVSELGPTAMAALRAWDPSATALSDEIMGQASEELAAGGRLTAAETRQALAGIRAGQASRGMGYGGGDVYTEALQMGNLAAQRKQARQAFAQSALNQRAALVGDPYSRILGAGSGVNALGTAGSAYGASNVYQADPNIGLAGQLALGGYQGNIAQAMGAWQERMRALQGLGRSTGNLFDALKETKWFS